MGRPDHRDPSRRRHRDLGSPQHHPIHIHEIQFQVVNRQPLDGGEEQDPEPSETGFKDTVIAYPGQITRVKGLFDLPGRYVWHCHILEHEDHEMMRPYHVGPQEQPKVQVPLSIPAGQS